MAGPNGCGKSTFHDRTDIESWGGSVWIINPDLLTQQIVEREVLPLDEANIAALERVEEWLYRSIEVYQTIGVETVLSSPKYRALVERAKQRGFEIRLIYIVLASAELQRERVGIRVSEGGHDVPSDKIAVRRTRSFEQFVWFYRQADICYVYDNSTGEPQLLGSKIGDAIFRYRPFPDDLQRVLDDAGIPFVDFPPQ